MSTGKGNEIIQAERLEALDVFRGFTIALMILVNTPGCWSCVMGLSSTPTGMAAP
jgi:predicted acyltransferase